MRRTGDAVFGAQRFAVHLVAEQVAGRQRVSQGHAASELLGDCDVETAEGVRLADTGVPRTGDAAVVADRHRARIGAPKHHLGGRVERSSAPQQRRQRGAAPHGVADTTDEERQPGVAGAFEGELDVLARL